MPGGCGPDQHILAAQAVEHPFAAAPELGYDIQFAVDAHATLGRDIRQVRNLRCNILRRLFGSVKSLDARLLAARHVFIADAPGVRPMVSALLVVLLRWPDLGVPLRIAQGFELAGDIPPSQVSRPIESRSAGRSGDYYPHEKLLGNDAELF